MATIDNATTNAHNGHTTLRLRDIPNDWEYIGIPTHKGTNSSEIYGGYVLNYSKNGGWSVQIIHRFAPTCEYTPKEIANRLVYLYNQYNIQHPIYTLCDNHIMAYDGSKLSILPFESGRTGYSLAGHWENNNSKEQTATRIYSLMVEYCDSLKESYPEVTISDVLTAYKKFANSDRQNTKPSEFVKKSKKLVIACMTARIYAHDMMMAHRRATAYDPESIEHLTLEYLAE